MVSKGLEKVIKLLKHNVNLTIKNRINEERKGFELLASMLKVPKDIKIEPININGIPAEWIKAPNIVNNNTILFLHGGAYICGSLNTHRELTARISQATKARVLNIDYRLAPEYPFPAAVEDATKVYRWLIEELKIPSEKIIIAGDSAGGGLTLATLINLRDSKKPLPIAAICLSPWTDLGLTGESFKKNAKIDPVVTPESLFFSARLYLGDNKHSNPLASPLYADLEGLPPIYIQVGTNELLLDDSIRFAQKAKNAGVNVTLDIWRDMIHVFSLFASIASEGQQGIDKIGEFVQKIFP